MRAVVGTAGHVDHGKSTLVRALTGVDPDRLAEERRRGMTIELGFAEWTFPSGEQVGIVDVPGHHRFLRTMLAGAHGIDLVLLVVAADEGVMPQTREHLAICELLGARCGVVALSRSDLVEPDVLELARQEVVEMLQASSFRGAPVVSCSAVTGAGLDQLAAVTETALRGLVSRPDRGRPRLWIDRSFAIAGFGTVVTGTLDGGALHTGEEVAVIPGERRARIRGLQHHNRSMSAAEPGRRTAVNLGGISHGELRRGMALVRPDSHPGSARLDVRLRMLRESPAALRHRSRVILHIGAAETAASAWLLEGAELAAGEVGFAQLQLDTPVAALHHDRFVIRRPTPAATLGGGVVLDISPRRHRRGDPAVARTLERRGGEDLAATVLEELRKHRMGAEPAALARATGSSRLEVDDALARLGGSITTLGRRRLAGERWEQLRETSRNLLAAHHAAQPLRASMAREEWRSRLRLPARLAGEVVQALSACGDLIDLGEGLALPGHLPTASPAAIRTEAAILGVLAERGLDPPGASELGALGLTAPLRRHLVQTGGAVSIGELLLSADAFASARAAVVAHLSAHGSATVAELRDAVGTTRRLAVPLLEALDAARVTVRDGDRRQLRRPPA